jgi:5-methylthioadenosine/S-adenosylhomocysteine deaminase
VTTVADTGDSGAALQVLAETGGSGVAYQEVFGPHPDQSEQSLSTLREKVKAAGRWVGNRVHIGVSPHAPYSVSGPLFRAVAVWARSEGLPLAVHIAESRAETELLANGSGPFADAWRARGIPLPRPSGLSPVAWLAEHAVLREGTLCIHAVQVDAADISRLADSGTAVAHCPLSNEAHGHGAAPIREMLRAGIRIGIGTDSEVSIGRLDMLAEARAARGLAGLTADAAIELCTLGGARALGLASETGSLRIGKWADCVVIGLHNTDDGHPPGELVLASFPTGLRVTCLGGRDVYRAL